MATLPRGAAPPPGYERLPNGQVVYTGRLTAASGPYVPPGEQHGSRLVGKGTNVNATDYGDPYVPPAPWQSGPGVSGGADQSNAAGGGMPNGPGNPAWEAANQAYLDAFAGAPTGPATDFYAMARALYPWMPEPLLNVFATAWATHGNVEVALGVMRQAPQYEQYFPGNRRPDGTFRHTEAEYMAVIDGYRQTLADYGLNPAVFEGQGAFVRAITGDVSVAELADRAGMINSRIVRNKAEVRQVYAEEYGIALDDAGLFAVALDPTVGRAILDQRISVAQLSGEALSFGHRRGRGRVEELLAAGVTQEQARPFYAQAAERTATLSEFAKRYYDPDDDFDLDELEDAALLLDDDERRRAERLILSERSAFTDSGGILSDQEGRLRGLVQR